MTYGSRPDASADAIADAIVDDAIVIDSSRPPLLEDAGSDEVSTFVDVPPLPPFDASLPAPPSCDAGGYFVTIVDGAGVQVLDGGCADAGAWAVPALVSYGCGNLCGYSQVEVCGGGLSLRLQQTYPPAPYGSSPVSFSVSVSFIDGNGNLLLGAGTIDFSTPPYVNGVYGTTVAGSYSTQTLTTTHGQPVGAIEGTFCLLDAF